MKIFGIIVSKKIFKIKMTKKLYYTEFDSFEKVKIPKFCQVVLVTSKTLDK